MTRNSRIQVTIKIICVIYKFVKVLKTKLVCRSQNNLLNNIFYVSILEKMFNLMELSTFIVINRFHTKTPHIHHRRLQTFEFKLLQRINVQLSVRKFRLINMYRQSINIIKWQLSWLWIYDQFTSLNFTFNDAVPGESSCSNYIGCSNNRTKER